MLMIAAVATSVTAVGSKSYLKEIIEKFTEEEEQASVINVEDMDTQASESADETQVYREIEKELGIQVVRMEYKPKTMLLQRYVVDKAQKRAQMFYEYNGAVVVYSVYINSEDSSFGKQETDKIVANFEVDNNQSVIEVKEYEVEKYESHRFVAEFENYGMHYQLRAVMEKDEFKKILKNLKIF